jgi:hypothetical protein
MTDTRPYLHDAQTMFKFLGMEKELKLACLYYSLNCVHLVFSIFTKDSEAMRLL